MKEFIKEKKLFDEFVRWKKSKWNDYMKNRYTPKKERIDREKRNEKIIELYELGRKRIDISYALEIPYCTVANIVSTYRASKILSKLARERK